MMKIYVDEKGTCTGCGYRGLVEDDGLCGKCWFDKAQPAEPNDPLLDEFAELFSH